MPTPLAQVQVWRVAGQCPGQFSHLEGLRGTSTRGTNSQGEC